MVYKFIPDRWMDENFEPKKNSFIIKIMSRKKVGDDCINLFGDFILRKYESNLSYSRFRHP
ncbi:hypothetical protein RhiirC2_784034 [Rhizophagus irregularis]|uniref:Uncharacterized protein n=1 Tax=Rhizophagus irregularis TaxID=588596 RepID=A0A2N1MZF7_9GLOM|nr:hypothetical protein RhiirC2_784034 [Rhizophagus irregularis]